MQILFSLAWLKKGSSTQRAFKSNSTGELFHDYVQRISHFSPCQTRAFSLDDLQNGKATRNGKLWLCERKQNARALSTEELSLKLEALLGAGGKQFEIVVGGPDGFSEEQIELLSPDFCWSFGSLTLPHELAAIIAGEQIYRAFTILHNLPYHSKH